MLLHESAEKTAKWIDSWMVEVFLVTLVAFIGLAGLAYGADPAAVEAVLMMTVALSPVWLPIGLFVGFWHVWMHYIRWLWWLNTPMVLLHIELPAEITKSPLAMELFLTALFQTGGETTFIQRIWKGQYRPIWSLEIVGREGRVDYFLHARKVFKNVVEARLYGQFPEAKITEVEDYAQTLDFESGDYELWGSEYAKTEPQALPVRTYIDWELNKNPDTPEVQVDPLTNVLEFLGSMGPGEHVWMQIIAKGRKKDEWYGFYLEGVDKYRDPALKKIKSITKAAIERAQGFIKKEESKEQAAARATTLLTEGERRQVDSMERSLTKLVFECGFRVLYIARREKYRGPNVPKIVTFFHSFRYPGYNSLNSTRALSDFNYPWQDFGNIRQNRMKHLLIQRYRERAYFYVPYDQVPVFMTTEELATIWHFPSSVVKTPGLSRVSSRRAEAPPNLPTLPS